jgi:hypothetical protein
LSNREPETFGPRRRSQGEDERRRQSLARCDRPAEMFAPSEYGVVGMSFASDEDLPCRCVRADVDVEAARDCPVHGPESELALRVRQQEADDLAAYYAQGPFDEEWG